MKRARPPAPGCPPGNGGRQGDRGPAGRPDGRTARTAQGQPTGPARARREAEGPGRRAPTPVAKAAPGRGHPHPNSRHIGRRGHRKTVHSPGRRSAHSRAKGRHRRRPQPTRPTDTVSTATTRRSGGAVRWAVEPPAEEGPTRAAKADGADITTEGRSNEGPPGSCRAGPPAHPASVRGAKDAPQGLGHELGAVLHPSGAARPHESTQTRNGPRRTPGRVVRRGPLAACTNVSVAPRPPRARPPRPQP